MATKTKQTATKVTKEKPVELGFIEPSAEKWRLSSAYFSSKFGGHPSWLDLRRLPSAEEIQCPKCSGPTKFLLQIYSPLDTDDSFHRTIFLFVCTNQKCCGEKNCNTNFVVLRCQLRQENDFYSPDPPEYENSSLAEISPKRFGNNLCHVCGIKAGKFCSKCKKMWYCSKQHQELHWKSGNHKKLCKKLDSGEERGKLFCFTRIFFNNKSRL